MTVKKATKKKKKPAPEEYIYQSILGDTIRSGQYINEILSIYRASFLGLQIDRGYIEGERFYEHPQIAGFYQTQFGDISTAIRRYGGRVVAAAIAANKWVANPRYGDRPLRGKKIQAIMKEMKTTCAISKEQEELPHNHEALRQKQARNF